MAIGEQFRQSVRQSTSARKSRHQIAAYVLRHPGLADELISLAIDVGDENHFKACWILELVLERDLSPIAARLGEFCDALNVFTHDSAVRPVTKICLFCAAELEKNRDFLSEKQLVQITEASFERLISDEKVAAKANAIKTLYETGKYLDWVYPELRPLLQHGFAGHSPAYKLAAKKLLAGIGN